MSIPETAHEPAPPTAASGFPASALPLQRGALFFALAALVFGTAWLAAGSTRISFLFLVGGALGASLLATGFGFTSGYRRAILSRDVSHVQAQLLMLALATLLFAPVLAGVIGLDRPVVGALAPAGLPVLLGAFLFGIGMQLGDGCASGTLYGAGGGSIRNLVTLAAFCAGAFGATFHLGWWSSLPTLGTVSLASSLGWPGALALQLLIFVALTTIVTRWSREGKRNQNRKLNITVATTIEPLKATIRGWISRHRVLAFGAVSLATLNLVTLLVAGHPWTITWAFGLWGAKTAAAAGWDPAASAFWSGGFPASALSRPVAADVTSVMNVGIMLGALAVASWRGRFRPGLPIGARQLLASVLAGLMLGYGARIAFGCNIGAFFSGIASGSLHGWLWIAAALPGTWLGIQLRPLFGLVNETEVAGP